MYIPTGRPRGRPPGSPNKRSTAIKEAVAKAAKRLETEIPDAFVGDAHAFLVSIYKDPAQPLELRLDAAGKAIRYEKPALSSIESKGEVKHVIRRTPMTPTDWAKERAGEDSDDLGAAVGTGPARRH